MIGVLEFLKLSWKPLLAILVAGAILFAIHRWGERRYAAGYGASESKWLVVQASAERAAREALEAQIAQSRKTTLANQATLHDLQSTTAAIAADRDRSVELARRLLAAASRPAPASHQLPEADHRPAAADPGKAGSAIDVAELLANAAAECRGNGAQLNALIAEIRPQL